MQKLSTLSCIAFSAALVTGCSLLHREPAIVESGYLTDYSLLQPAGGDERAQLFYRNPDADFSKFDKIRFERVSIWVAHADEIDALTSEDFQHLADGLYLTIHAALDRDYEMVHEPGPGVMTIHLALTHVTDPDAAHDVFSSMGHHEHEMTASGALAPATESFVNEALIEAEFVDAESGETLAAVIDPWTRQAHHLRGKITTWSGIHEAFEFWAERISERLGEARRGEI